MQNGMSALPPIADIQWDTRGKKPNDPVEGFRVPLFCKLLIRLRWRGPLGTASNIKGLAKEGLGSYSVTSNVASNASRAVPDRGSWPSLLALTDQQLKTVLDVAGFLPRRLRRKYLKDIAARLPVVRHCP